MARFEPCPLMLGIVLPLYQLVGFHAQRLHQPAHRSHMRALGHAPLYAPDLVSTDARLFAQVLSGPQTPFAQPLQLLAVDPHGTNCRQKSSFAPPTSTSILY